MRFILRVAVGLMAALAAQPAPAVVGGREGGPGEASAVMVLTDRGGHLHRRGAGARGGVTAAHCVAGGAQVRVHYREQGQPVLLEPRAVARHRSSGRNAVQERARSIDLALVRLAQPLPGRFAPAALAASAPVEGGGAHRRGLRPVGRGRGADGGRLALRGLAARAALRRERVLLWLRGPMGAGGCQGDSGGPALDGAGAVAGLVSWTTGPSGRRCGDLTQAVILSAQRGWIDRILAGWGLSAAWR